MHSVARTSLSLLAIAGVAAALLGFVSGVTAEPIAQQEKKTRDDAMKSVLPIAESFDENATDVGQGVITSYTAGLAGDDVCGYAFSVETKGFSSGLNLMIGIDSEGTVTGVTVVKHSETPGLGANAETVLSPQFPGKKGELTVVKTGSPGETEINAITGATITSRAVTNAVNEVQDYFNDNLKGGN